MKKLPVLLLLLAGVACLAAAVIHCGAAYFYNYGHLGFFQRIGAPPTRGAEGEQNVYAAGMPLEEMDFGQVFYAVTKRRDTHAILLADIQEIVLPCTVRYYTEPDDSGELLCELTAGTEVYIDFDLTDLWDRPYACFSYPTYSRGWRYAAPFLPTADAGPFRDSYERYDVIKYGGTCGYVRLEVLQEVMCSALEQQEKSYQDLVKTMLGITPTHRETALILTQILDWWMYSSGYYVSPDIYHEPWDGWTVGLLAAGGVLLAADGALVLRGRKRR